MKLTIYEKKDNHLLERIEVSGDAEFEGATFSKAQLSEALASNLKTDSNLIIIKHIYTKFSQQKATFEALAYKTSEAKVKCEPKVKVKGPKEAPKKDTKKK